MRVAAPVALAIAISSMCSSTSWAQVNCDLPIPGGAAAADIQACLNVGNTVVLQEGGIYDIDTTLEIVVDGTTLRGESAENRPILRATPDLHGHILLADDHDETDPRRGYALQDLVFDGNLAGRLNQANTECATNPELGNVVLKGYGWTVSNVLSTGAVCKSSMEVKGQNFEIRGSTFSNNGLDMWEASGGWADGLTVWRCDSGHIYNNTFSDNTDVDLIIGGGFGCVVEGNVITNIWKHAFAGMNVGTFGPGADHSGSVYRDNTIVSAPDQMAFGLMVGNEPWWNPWGLDVFIWNAGEIYGNVIRGAVVNLAVDGIGAGNIHDNYPYAPDGHAGFFCNSMSANFTAHDFGTATISGDWQPVWFFSTANRQRAPYDGCGVWDVNLPRPDNPGALIHQRGIPPGSSLWSDNGLYRLTYEADAGALLVYDANGAIVHDFHVPPHAPGVAVMQWDGNFVVYDASSRAQFSTRTNGFNGAYLVMQGDGNVVVYDLSSVARWSSWFSWF